MRTISIKRQFIIQATFLFVFFLFFSGTNKNYATLKISIKDCRSNNLEYLDELKIIKSNKRIKLLKPQHNCIQTLNNLDTGTYFVEYKSIFGKTEKLKIIMTEYKKYSVDLCINYINFSSETYKPIIDQIQDKESYKILMSSNGCFHSNDDTLTIFRDNNMFTAKWSTKNKTLTPADVDAVRHFEIELNYMSEGSCTTQDTYIVIYKDKEKAIEDGNCRWDGGINLKNKLFNNQ